MKTHTQKFKENIKLLGKELDGKISYTVDGNIITLSNEDLNNVTPVFSGGILKSVMKELDIDSNVDIPIGTILNYKFGLKIDDSYEYLDFGNYIVYSSEKQEDTSSYKIVCYDKMLYSMKKYESLNISYPITVKEYIKALCEKLGIDFFNYTTDFANSDKIIKNELYLDAEGNSLDYTFRDVFDELAQVTASTICINQNDELEIRYINDTNDIIDEEYLKDTNVNFGEKYGPINSIVLSRSAESDNVYLKDQESVEKNGLCEIKILDNQIMNWNDRSDYLPDILEKLKGLEYYINDFESPGICYYDLCDKYSIKVNDALYNCVMFNDEQVFQQGLTENIFTDLPKETKTDYTKSDKTDRRINQAYILVDKQNQKITALTSEVNQYDNRISTVEQTVDSLTQKVEAGYDFVREASGNGNVLITDAVVGDLLYLKITGEVSILPNTYTYPSENLFPHDALYLLIEGKEESKRVKLPFFSLHTYNGHSDEFVLENGVAKLIRKVGVNSDDSRYLLDVETVTEYSDFNIQLFDGDNKISIIDFSSLSFKSRYAIHNEITDKFATKAELSSSITQTKNEINLEVSKKVDNEEIISTINQSAEEVKIKANKIGLEGYTTINEGFSVDEEGNASMNNANIKGGNITIYDTSSSDANIKFVDKDDSNTYSTVASHKIQLKSSENNVEVYNSDASNWIKLMNWQNQKYIYIENNDFGNYISLYDDSNEARLEIDSTGGGDGNPYFHVQKGSSFSSMSQNGVWSPSFNNTSTEDVKKNIRKLSTNALKLITSTDLYKYNYKDEDNKTKKHIGIVIGNGYNYPEEILSSDGKGVDLYSMVSVCFKAIQEQQIQIQELKEEINKLKEGDK